MYGMSTYNYNDPKERGVAQKRPLTFQEVATDFPQEGLPQLAGPALAAGPAPGILPLHQLVLVLRVGYEHHQVVRGEGDVSGGL